MEAQIRTLRTRITLCKTGRIGELWDRLCEDHKRRSTSQIRTDEDRVMREAERVARLVDQGLLSRAASQLCSRGLAPNSPETKAKVKALFPRGGFPLKANPSFEIHPEADRKLFLQFPKGLGLRSEHLKVILCDRNPGTATQCLLTKFTSALGDIYRQSSKIYMRWTIDPSKQKRQRHPPTGCRGAVSW